MRDIMKLLQQAQEMQGQYQKIQDELQQMTLTGTAGGGMVTAEVNGQGLLKRIKLDASVVNPADTEMLEDLITVAVARPLTRSTSRKLWRVASSAADQALSLFGTVFIVPPIDDALGRTARSRLRPAVNRWKR